ncbi:MAG: hypothetical protein ACJA0U_000294 [Salibacteraceae bacterium]|jgi:uncharacterized protein (DUF2132 family)
MEESNDPLHGKSLEFIVKQCVDRLGWEQMSYHVNVNCFKSDPSVKSSLKFLRRTPWARAKVEKMYIERVLQFDK